MENKNVRELPGRGGGPISQYACACVCECASCVCVLCERKGGTRGVRRKRGEERDSDVCVMCVVNLPPLLVPPRVCGLFSKEMVSKGEKKKVKGGGGGRGALSFPLRERGKNVIFLVRISVRIPYKEINPSLPSVAGVPGKLSG